MNLPRPNGSDRPIARRSERSKSSRRRLSVESLESRCLLSIYQPRTPSALSPAPVDGTPLAAGTVVASFANESAPGSLSATVSFNGGASVPADVIPSPGNGTEFVPNKGDIPQYLVTLEPGSFTPTGFGAGALQYVVQINDSSDSTTSSAVGSSDVQNSSPSLLITNGGISATAGTPIVNQQLAVFTDTSSGLPETNFVGIIDWGDGTPESRATFAPLGSGQFSILGSHTYASPLTAKISLLVEDIGGLSIVGATSPVTVANTAIDTPQPISVSGMQGQLLNDVPLLTFISRNPLATPAFFTAQIAWGDGSTSLGTLRRVGSGILSSTFQVSGSHTYQTTSDSPFTITLNVSDVFGGSLPAQTTTASIIQSPLTVSVLSFNANVATLTGAATALAIVTDASGRHPAGDYTATINWGDGSPDSTVAGTSFTAGPGGTLIVPSPGHTYARPGLHPVTVTVKNGDQAIGAGGGSAFVNSSPAVPIPSPVPSISSVAGNPIPANSTVGRFVIGASGVSVNGLTAVIDWGDGSPTALGTVVASGSSPSSSTFDVKGNHVYARPGGYTITTTFTDQSHTSATTTTAATVSDPLLTAPQGYAVKGNVGRSLVNVPVATFVDPNPLSRATGIAATIDWGDGTGSSGTVTAIGSLANGVLFAVSGTHAYTNASGSVPFTITTKVLKAANNANSLTIASTATITQSTLNVAVFPVIAVARNTGSIPANTIIAVFTDTRGSQSPSSYTATISWGEGRQPARATVAALGGGAYAVLSSHTYTARGVFAIKVNVQAVDSLSHSTRTGYGANLATVNPGTTAAAVRAAIKAQRRTARHRHR